MISKFQFYCVFQVLSLLAFGQAPKSNDFIDPTGTYKLPYEIKGNDVYGPFGEVMVKLLKPNKIVVGLFICRGAPNYNNGSFIDTLVYVNNRAIYKTPYDSTCSIIMTFKINEVEIEQNQANLNFGCDFGQGVFADGEYRKVSGKLPIISDVG